MRSVQDALEKGHFRGKWAHLLAGGWARVAARSVVRPLDVPAHVRLVTIGGATLGGSGKTPVAVAWALREVERGRNVVLIGHAYRARPERARVVTTADDPYVVGDEALVAARELGTRARVVVAPTRQSAIDFAVTSGADTLVVDGVLQTAPRRADVAVLVRDAAARASFACPPVGDLRAPLELLRAEADVEVEVGGDVEVEVGAEVEVEVEVDRAVSVDRISAHVESRGAFAADGSLVTFERLRGMRLGLALAIAHPERVTRRLAARGVAPVALVTARDHEAWRLPNLMRRVMTLHTDIDAWLTTSKCAAFLGRRAPRDAPEIYVVDHRVLLPAALP